MTLQSENTKSKFFKSVSKQKSILHINIYILIINFVKLKLSHIMKYTFGNPEISTSQQEVSKGNKSRKSETIYTALFFAISNHSPLSESVVFLDTIKYSTSADPILNYFTNSSTMTSYTRK